MSFLIFCLIFNYYFNCAFVVGIYLQTWTHTTFPETSTISPVSSR